MSQQSIYDVDLKDEDLLLEALKDMGYKPETYKEAVDLQTYGNLGKVKAHIVIRKQQAGFTYADMGFERIDGGFKLHADHIDIRKFNLTQLKQKYTKAFLAKKIKLLGTQYVIGAEEIDQNGTMKLKLKVMEQ